ncbi:MAG: hypothetical protein GX772_07895, partial [Alcaligenaceae bacterium]|nr:hypothetical protein [Alcaligenaceae bacterium]
GMLIGMGLTEKQGGSDLRRVTTLAEMAGYTRLDCVLGSTALMRSALVQAMHHAPDHVAEAFIDSRLGDDNLGVAGMAASPTALDSVLQRAWAPAFS